MNILLWIEKSAKKLSLVPNPRYEAEFFLSYVTGHNRASLIASNSIKLSKKQYQHLNYLVHRRSLGEPIAYIIREKEFWSLSLRVSYDTLIPRPDTEILVEQALSKIQNKLNASILDLGTGCGAIALALASVYSNCSIVGIDKSKKALKIAKINAYRLNIKNVSFYFSNWFSHIHKKFDIIVSNPPYVSKKEIKLLAQDIFFEPFDALLSDNNGLLDIEIIIKKAKKYLFSGGYLLIEHGWKQKKKCNICLKNIIFLK